MKAEILKSSFDSSSQGFKKKIQNKLLHVYYFMEIIQTLLSGVSSEFSVCLQVVMCSNTCMQEYQFCKLLQFYDQYENTQIIFLKPQLLESNDDLRNLAFTSFICSFFNKESLAFSLLQGRAFCLTHGASLMWL